MAADLHLDANHFDISDIIDRTRSMSIDSKFNNAQPTPIVSRVNSIMDDDMSRQLKSYDNNEMPPMPQFSKSKSLDSASPVVSGGILSKYKKSGLLLKPRRSYLNNQHSPSLNSKHIQLAEMFDIKEEEEQNNNNQMDADDIEIDYKNSPQASPSPKSERFRFQSLSKSPGTPEFKYKARLSKSIARDADYQVFNDDAKQQNISKSDFKLNPKITHIQTTSSVIGIIEENNQNNLNKNVKSNKAISFCEYGVIIISSAITWIFYSVYIAFYNWMDEISQFNDGNPSQEWWQKYIFLVIIYVIFIWCNMGFNPFYFSYFRQLLHTKSNEINHKNYKNKMAIFITRFCIFCSIAYCIVMSILCIVRFDDYSVRLAQTTVLYVLFPALITNVIISGFLLKQQPGIFIAFHCISWLIANIFSFFLFYDALDLTNFFIVSICAFCIYLISAVCIKASIIFKESDYHRKQSSKKQPSSPQSISILSVSAVSTMESIVQSNNNEQIKEQIKSKPISCCCNHFEFALDTFFKFQSVISAITFWSFWAILSIIERPKYDTITELLFVIACTWFNPINYSTTKRVSRSYRKYMLNFYFIFGVFVGLTQCAIFSLYWYIKVTYGKNIGIDGSNGIHLGIFDDLVLNEQNVRYLSFAVCLFASFMFYFPATGYLFYRSPLSFGLSHLFFAIISIFIPLAILDIADRQNGDNLIKINNIEYGITFLRDEVAIDSVNEENITIIILYMVVFAIFLSLSGFSCTYFRFKKVLVESQSIVTGYKSLQYRLEYPMTLTMFLTLCMAFGDLVTDFLFAFVEIGLKPWIKWTSRTLFVIQVILQLFSLQSVMMTVRSQLSQKNAKHRLRFLREYLFEYIGKCGIFIIYPFVWLFYYFFLFLVSLMLGLSKIIAIRQAQTMWLALIIHNYEKTANKRLKQKEKEINAANIKKAQIDDLTNPNRRKSQIPNQRHSKIGSDDDGNDFFNFSDDDMLNLNDWNQIYWNELDKMYKINEERQYFESSSSENEQYEENKNQISDNSKSDQNDKSDQEQLDDDNISVRIQKANRRRTNLLKNQLQNGEIQKQKIEKNVKKKKRKKVKKKKKKKKKGAFLDKVWLGWDTGNDELGIIFKIYLFIDKYTPKWMRQFYINANVYNTYFLTELIVESLPQSILITTNVYLTNDWTPISIASIFFSGGMIVYNVLKIVYYVGYLGKDMRSVVL